MGCYVDNIKCSFFEGILQKMKHYVNMLCEVFTFARLIHMELWNPWNQCWLGPQPIHCSMDIMDSIWNYHGMVNSIWNPSLFHMDSTGFHMESGHIHHGFHGQVHMDSMEQVHMDSMEQIQMDLMIIIFVVSLLF